MKIVDPNNASHNIDLIPRFENFSGDTIIVSIYDETTKEMGETTILSPTNTNGILSITIFNFLITPVVFINNSTYQLKIVDNNNDVVYRGKILATTQDPQSFKLTDGLYTYN